MRNGAQRFRGICRIFPILLVFFALAGSHVVARAAAHTGAAAVDRILIVKQERKLYLLRGGEVVDSFRIALGWRPRGPKRYEGDGRTPEGRYFIDGFLPDSDFYRAIKISYPSPEDRARARAEGLDPGGQIMIHGLDPALAGWEKDHWLFNWTNGCIAVTNREMDILWQTVELGTPVEIRP